MEEVLMEASVLDVVGSNLGDFQRKNPGSSSRNKFHCWEQNRKEGVQGSDRTRQPELMVDKCPFISSYLFLAFNLYANMKTNGPGNRGLVCPLLQVVPHVHLTGKRSHLNEINN